jgi:CTP:molybdopterin cytidylyltransferase MocA
MIGAALLAAGGSTRLGQPKQLLQLAGVPLVQHVLTQLLAADVEHTAVVLGCEAERVASALTPQDAARAPVTSPIQADRRFDRLINDDWREGMASSIRCAVRWAAAHGCEALLLVACDQPKITTAHLGALCARWHERGGAVASAYANTLGVPAIVPASWFTELTQLRGDRGAGARLRADPHVQIIPWPDGALDVDTPTDVTRAGLS